MEQTGKRAKTRGCLPTFGWMVFLVLAIILIIFFAAASLHDLGVWDEFWDLIGR